MNSNNFRSEGYRNVKCSNNNKYYNIYVCIIDKTSISFFNWLRNKIYCWTIITSYGYDCTISIYILQTFISIHFFSQNKAENICVPGAQKQSEVTGAYL